MLRLGEKLGLIAVHYESTVLAPSAEFTGRGYSN